MAGQRQIVREAAQRFGVDPRVLWGVYGTETNFGRNISRSKAGAEGPFQFMPGTARSLGVNPHNFRSAAFGAAKYLSQFKSRGTAGMLSAYNAGPAGGLQPGYVRTTLENAKRWGGGPVQGEAGPPGGEGGAPQGVPTLGLSTTSSSPQLVAGIAALLEKVNSAAQDTPSRAAGVQLKRPSSYAQLAMPKGPGPVAPLEPAPQPSVNPKDLLPLIEGIAGAAGTDESKVVQTGTAYPSGPGAALPQGTKLGGFLPGAAPLTLERIDQGQDFRTTPGGPILAPGAGVVLMVKNNPGGFGAAYPVVRFTSGPLRGRTVYIGHVKAALAAGQHFGSGAVLGHTGYGKGPYVGNAVGIPGHAEIGLWGPSGPGDMQAGRQIRPLLGIR